MRLAVVSMNPPAPPPPPVAPPPPATIKTSVITGEKIETEESEMTRPFSSMLKTGIEEEDPTLACAVVIAANVGFG
jgi:hypothetical protein